MGGKPCKQRLTTKAQDIIFNYANGMSIDKLALQCCVNPTTMRRFLLSQGVILRPPIRPKILNKVDTEVISLYHKGWNTKQLAKKFNVDRNTVSYFLQSRGILRKASLSKRTFFIKQEADIGMLAGLLLGEGSIIIRGSISIRISNQEAAIMGWLAKFGGKIYWSKPRKGALNPCAVWCLNRSVDVFHCLFLVLPLLVGKKRILAVAALNLLKNNYGLQETVSIVSLKQ
jgi:uncharacterized protein (DUF433 family)